MSEVQEKQARERSRQRGWDGAALHAAFQAARPLRPWTAGFRSFDRDQVECAPVLSASLPSELRGVLYRNGPARHDRGGLRYGHRWDGDGMVQRFAFTDDGISHLGRYIETTKFRADSEAGRLVTSAFGTRVPGSDVLQSAVDDANASNINVIEWAGELLALWEAGSAYAVDPNSLATKGVKAWSQELAGRPFSAHPRIDSDGTMWNFGVDPVSDELTIYRIDAKGRLLTSHIVKLEQLPPIHDFAVTAHKLVFLMHPLVLNKERLAAGTSFAEACQWNPALGMRVLILDKADWFQNWLTLPPGCLFHIANAWERSDGTIEVDYMRSEDPMSLLAGWSVMQGQYRHQQGARLTSASLDPAREGATQATIGEYDAEFPVVASGDVGRRHRSILHLERSDGRRADVPGFDVVALRDMETGDSQRFAYGDDWLVEEHVFAGARGEREPRWVVGTALDMRTDQTVVSVFDATALGAGPITQARLPFSLPQGLHGSFVPA
jgi:all-trans-8'-apo-beta-carotenal 15,15'-oxygenase